jgi:predicted nucleic acid-binding protein
LAKLLETGDPLVTTNYVALECCARAQHRLGLKAVRAIQDNVLPVMTFKWIDESLHAMAMNVLLASKRTKLSLVDCTSFLVMRHLDLSTAFAFDRHFDEEGFLFPS